MLQKLTIALFTMFLLSACGGSSNSSAPETQDPPPVDNNGGDDDDDTNGDDDDANGDDDDTQSDGWLNITFEDASDVDTWSYLCVDGCNTTVELEHNSDAAAMDVTPSWADGGDQVEVSTSIDPEIADLTDGYAHLKLYVPEAYTSAGDMVAQVFFQDASERKAYIGWRTVSEGWNTFYFEDIQLGTGDNDPFGFLTEGFDLTNINRMGIQLQGDEGFIDLEATLHIDDVIISPEPIVVDDENGEDEPYEPTSLNFTFEDGIDGWHIDGTGNTTTQETDNLSLSHDEDNNALVITPLSWDAIENNWNYQSRVEVPVTDLSSAVVRVEIYIPEAYITDGGLSIQFATSGGGSWTDAPDGLQAGMNTIDFDLSEKEGITEVQTVGVQLSTAPADTDIKAPIAVHSITVYEDGNAPALPEEDENAIPEGDVSYRFVDNIDGWYINGEADQSTTETDNITLTHDADSESMVVTPLNWDVDGWRLEARTNFDAAVDLTDAVVTFTLTVPESYINDEGVNFQLNIVADAGDAYTGWQGVGNLEAGETTITIDLSTREEDITASNTIGFQFATSPNDETITDPIMIRGVDIELAPAQ